MCKPTDLHTFSYLHNTCVENNTTACVFCLLLFGGPDMLHVRKQLTLYNYTHKCTHQEEIKTQSKIAKVKINELSNHL